MTATTNKTGHVIEFIDGEWRYQDNGLLADENRECKKCGKNPGEGGLDPCLMPLIAALNCAGLKTVASCCGHGFLPASIILEDGREVIVARSWKEARKMINTIGYNICGDEIELEKREQEYTEYCECGAKIEAYDYSDTWKYCPYCSRKINNKEVIRDG